MSNLLMILSGWIFSAVVVLLWRLAVSQKQRVEDAMNIAAKQLRLLRNQNDILSQRIKKEVAKYDKFIKQQAQVHESIDAVDNAPASELLGFMQNGT